MLNTSQYGLICLDPRCPVCLNAVHAGKSICRELVNQPVELTCYVCEPPLTKVYYVLVTPNFLLTSPLQ
jgi:hypothetical protein